MRRYTLRSLTLRVWSGVVVSALGASGTAYAQKPEVPPVPATPPAAAPVVPFIPETPGEAIPCETDVVSRGVGENARRTPSMMGDLLAARSFRIGYNVPVKATFPGVTIATSGPLAGLSVNPNAAGALFTFGPTPNGTTRTASVANPAANLTYFQPTTGVGVDTSFAQAALGTLLSKNGAITPAQLAQINTLAPADRAALLANRGAFNTALTKATGGLNIPSSSVTNVEASVVAGVLTYTALLTGQTQLAAPGSSSSVGRIKMSEDNSVLTRDRVIFDYDYFDKVPFTQNGINVNRFQVGVEKTFADGRWSGEIRLPFASTLASSYTDGAEFRDVHLGNLRFALKRLWTQGEQFNLSTGLGITVPTAPDQVLRSQDGPDLIRFHNQSVQAESFIAALYTPNERLFSQAWLSLNIDCTGGKLDYNKDVFGGSGSVHMWDLPILALDYQIGYWLIKNDSGGLRGLAPFCELHYNYTVAQSYLIKEVNKKANDLGLTLTGIGNTELNITAGVAAQFGERVNASFGASFPLFAAPDRTFDVQYGLRLNYMFGRSATTGAPFMGGR